MQLNDILTRTPEIVSRMLDGEAVLVDPRRGMVRVLNSTGARLWEQIDGRRTVADLAADLAVEYGIEPAQAQADALAFCTDLVKRGALTPI